MRALAQLALAGLSVLALSVALMPHFAVLVLGAPGFARTIAHPAVTQAIEASLQAATIALAVGWPAGVLAALGVWGAGTALRRVVLGSAWLALFMAATLPDHGTGGPSAAVLALVPPVAAGASLVLLILTGALNTMDPRLLQTGQAIGASPARAWLTVLASLTTTLTFAAAACFALGLSLCVQMPGRLALAGLLRQAVSLGDVDTAPYALLLASLSLAPLALAGLLALPGRLVRRS